LFNPLEILYLAQNVALLTYFLGVLLYALPIPVYGIKKWAPKLVNDGIYASVWINSYVGLLYFITYLMQLLGISWQNFFEWLNKILGLELQLYLIIRSTYILASSTPDPAFTIFLSPISVFFSFLTGLITITETIIILSKIIYQYTPIFISIGILLLSIPFRIGRGIGASLISSFTVFYIGLPYLPIFLYNLNLDILNLQSVNNTNIGDLVNFLATTVLPNLISATVIMPLIYVGILAGLSIGLAFAISGTSGRLPFPIEII
jgi:hypothetical protein